MTVSVFLCFLNDARIACSDFAQKKAHWFVNLDLKVNPVVHCIIVNILQVFVYLIYCIFFINVVLLFYIILYIFIHICIVFTKYATKSLDFKKEKKNMGYLIIFQQDFWIIIRNVSWTPDQYISMISVGSSDTEWLLKMQVWFHRYTFNFKLY